MVTFNISCNEFGVLCLKPKASQAGIYAACRTNEKKVPSGVTLPHRASPGRVSQAEKGATSSLYLGRHQLQRSGSHRKTNASQWEVEH